MIPAMQPTDTTIDINGSPHSIDADESRSLLDVLRNELHLTGSHFGCGQGLCGACMVLVDGRAIFACDTPLWSVAGKSITTIEGVDQIELGAKLQQAFIDHAAAQCGYCTSGMLISAVALLSANPHPSDQQIRQEMDRNLCRCGSHLRIIAAIRGVADALPQGISA